MDLSDEKGYLRRRHLDIATAIVSLAIIAIISLPAPVNTTSEEQMPSVVHSLNDQP